MNTERLPQGLAERAIMAYFDTRPCATTATLHKAVERRARRSVLAVTTAQALARMRSEGKIEKVAQGLWLRPDASRSRLELVCSADPIWARVADVFLAKSDPFMALGDLLRKLPLDDEKLMRELRALKRIGVLEMKPYRHWAGASKLKGKGVGLTPEYQVQPEPATLEELLS